jgi:cell division protein FtsX
VAILTAIIGWVSQSWFGQVVSAALSWWNARVVAQNQANTAEQNAETQHQTDGAQSVADRDSADQQNSALDDLQKQMENPIPVVVIKPTPPTQPGGN